MFLQCSCIITVTVIIYFYKFKLSRILHASKFVFIARYVPVLLVHVLSFSVSASSTSHRNFLAMSTVHVKSCIIMPFMHHSLHVQCSCSCSVAVLSTNLIINISIFNQFSINFQLIFNQFSCKSMHCSFFFNRCCAVSHSACLFISRYSM